jgi:hypothetical protein
MGILAYIGAVLAAGWAMILEFLPILAKIGPWLASLLPFIPKFIRWVVSWFAADTAATLLKGAAAMGVRLAVVTAWGVMLAVVTTGISGLAIRDICFTNPFSGFPQAMMFLVAAAFPIKFALALITSYILFRITVYHATLFMSRSVKYMFGG